MPSGPCPRLLRENHQFPWNAGLCGLFDGLHPNKRRPPAAARAETLRVAEQMRIWRAFGSHLRYHNIIITTNPAKQTPSKHPAAILLDSAQVSDDTDRQDLQVGKISFSDILYCTEESVSVCAGDPNDTKRFWRRKRPTRAQPNPKDAHSRTMMRHKVW